MSPCCAYRTSILKLHSSGKLLTVRNKMKLYTLKQMHRYIYRDNCLYRRNMDNIDIFSEQERDLEHEQGTYKCSTKELII